MHDTEVYDAWEASRPDITRRSYLYPLPPVGVGTAAVESLTGYISRLAAAHAVETGALIRHELRPRIPCTRGVWAGRVREDLPQYPFYISAHTLNGVGARAQLWVSLLDQLTCVPRLDLLTALPWAGTISCVHLLRPSRAWCPACYGDELSSADSAYERLLWAFHIVTVCPVHRLPLESNCPFCGRGQYVLAYRSRPGYCSRCYRWLGRASAGACFHSGLTEQIGVAEMVGALLAAGPTLSAHFGLDQFRENVRSFVRDAGGYHRFRAGVSHLQVRNWVRRTVIPRMHSLVTFSHSQNVSLIRLVTERIDRGNKPDQKCVWNAHYRVKASVVEAALQAALQVAIPPSLPEIANQVGYRSVASLKFRYRALCREIVGRRRAQMRVSNKAPVPRERIEKALLEALSKPGFTDVRVVMASVGLRSTSRLYKDFRDLRLAIAAKNATIKRRRLEVSRAALITAIEAARATPCNQLPVPTVTEVAQRMGFATAEPLILRFPELTTELQACRRRATQGKYRHRPSERVRQRLTEALREFPPPSCAAVVRGLAGHWTQIREDFPDLWRSLRQRYRDYVREVHRAKREAFAGEVYRAVAELHGQGICPNVPLVVAAIPHPQFHSRNMVAKAVRLARHELSIKPYEAFRDQRSSGAAVNCRTNATFAETPDGNA